MKTVLHKPIPPTVVRVAAAIVLGVSTTVAVAWSLALLVDGGHGRGMYWWWPGRSYEVATQVRPTPPHSPQQTGLHFVSVSRIRRSGTDIVRVNETWSADGRQAWGSPHALVEGTSFAAEMKEKFDRGEAPTSWWRGDGWPLLALSAEARWRGAGGNTAIAMGGVLVGSNNVSLGEGVRILPLQPIWSGFVINTVLYASLWFALFSLGNMRSGFRRIRGQCGHCGYKLLPEQTRCSECGECVR